MTTLIQKIEDLKPIIKENEREFYIKEIRKVILEFEKNLNIIEVDEKLMSYLAILYLTDNKTEKTFFYLKKAYELKQNLQNSVNLAYFYISEEDDSQNKAIKILEDFLKQENHFLVPYSLLAQCYFEIENYEESEINLEKSILKDDNFLNLYNLAVVLFKQEKYKKAFECFEKAKKYASQNDLLLVKCNILVCNLFLNKKHKIIEELDYILQSDKEEINEILDIAKIYLIINQYQKAYDIFDTCDYYLSENWFAEKLYSLYKLNNLQKFNDEYKRFIFEKEEDIKDNSQDSDFCLDYENELKEEIEKIKKSHKQILNNTYKIKKDFHLYIKTKCYYFACIMHDNDYEIY